MSAAGGSPYRRAHEGEAPINLGVAVDRAAEVARRHGLAPTVFRATVTGTSVETRVLRRARCRLEPERTVVTSDHASGTDVHPSWLDPADFDSPAVNLPGEVTSDEELTPSECPAELAPPLDLGTERLVSARVQALSISVVRVSFAMSGASGWVDVAAHDGRVLAQSQLEPLVRRRLIGWGVLASAGLLSLVVLLAYASRDPWFVTHGHLLGITLLALGATFAATLAARELCLPAAARSSQKVLLAVSTALAFVLLMAVLWDHRRPSAERAEAHLFHGRVAEAEAEARALLRLDWSAPAARAVLDEIHRLRMVKAQTLDEMTRIVAEEWHTEAAREAAQRELNRAALAAADRAYAKAARFELERLSGPGAPGGDESRTHARALIRLLEVSDCVTRLDLACMERDLGQRVPPSAQRYKDSLAEGALGALRKELERSHVDRVDGASAEARQTALQRAMDLTRAYEKLSGRELVPSLKELKDDDRWRVWVGEGKEAQAKIRDERQATNAAWLAEMRRKTLP